MLTVKELQVKLISILNDYDEQYDAVMESVKTADKIAHTARPDISDSGIVTNMVFNSEIKKVIGQYIPTIRRILSKLSDHDSPEAVKAIRMTFSSKCVKFRCLALDALARMSIPKASKALARRAAWFSLATKGEKILAWSLLRHKEKH